MTNLGIIDRIIDNSRTYAAGSFEVWVTFTMFGITFKAHRFVRTDRKCECDNMWLYITHESSWCDDLVKAITADDADPVARRARHLLAVACAATDPDMDKRFELMELA